MIAATSQQHHLSSFDWHPNNENRILSVSMAGAVKDLTIFERIALVSTCIVDKIFLHYTIFDTIETHTCMLDVCMPALGLEKKSMSQL